MGIVGAEETIKTPTKRKRQIFKKTSEKEKEEVTFVPTDEEATNLYGESIKKPKPKNPPKHQYRN